MTDSMLIGCELGNRITHNIIDLPNELLDAICNYVEDDDALIALASLCSQLHSIALPIYFTRIGCNGSSLRLGYRSRLTLTDHTRQVLKGIRLYFALAPDQKFKKGLTMLDCSFIEATSDAFVAIVTLLGHIPFISSVRLRFHYGPRCQQFPELEFHSILKVLGNKSCTCLEIGRLSFRCSGSSEVPPLHTLERLIISGNQDLSSGFMNWIIAVMHTSPLQVLELRSSQHNIRTLLGPTVLAPHLKRLDVFSIISITSITPFLCRHPRVTKVHAAVASNPLQLLDTRAFMHLKDISATPNLVSLLLSAPSRAPNLTNIHLFTDSSDSSRECWEPRYSVKDDPMALLQAFTVLPKYPNISNLSLTLCEQFGSEEFLQDLQRESREQNRTVYALPQISSLDIYTERGLEDLIPGLLKSFPNFAQVLFPSLEVLSIHRCDINDVKKTRFIQQLHVACPKLSQILFPKN